jgi:uncharacterized protein
MTRQNRKKSATSELLRAQQAMLEAEALAKGGLYNGATSRAYYVVFHAARALLADIDVHPRTHRGVESLLEAHLVVTGRLAREHLRRYAQLQDRRNIADYGAEQDITAEQMTVVLADARAFLDAALALSQSIDD